MVQSADQLYGYLFAHFIGEQKDGEQVYFALSQDGMHWHDLNNKQPVLLSTVGECGVRDPYIISSPDGKHYYLMATDLCIYHRGGWENSQSTITGSHSIIIWESSDLVNWSDPRKIEVAPPDVGCTWAPEAIYDEEEDNYLVFWASMRDTRDGNGKGMHIYCSRTKDFRTFSEAQIYITRGEEDVILDTTIIKSGDMYYRASCDGEITIEACDRLMGEWTTVSTLNSMGLKLTGRDVEGPLFFKFNDENKWGLLVDQFATSKGYLPIITTDLSDPVGTKWRIPQVDEYSFGALKKRHGSILPITKVQYDAILAKWGNTNENE